MYIVGGLEDQTAILVWAQLQKNFLSPADASIMSYAPYADSFYGLVEPWTLSQPVLWLFVTLFLRLFGAGSYNILLALTTLVNIFLSYNFFKRFKYGIIYTLFFSLGTYYLLHVGKHIDLMQIWVFPVFFSLFLSPKFTGVFNFLHCVKLGVFVFISILISNYYGFFIVLYMTTFTVITIIYSLRFKEGIKVGAQLFKKYTVAALTAGVLSLFVLYPFIAANYMNTTDSEVKNNPKLYLERSYGDFFLFSSRPWFYVIPSPKNPLLGDTAESVLQSLKGTGNFLTQFYFSNEHSGNYFGLVFLSALAVLLFKYFKTLDMQNKNLIISLLSAAFVLFIFTFPPYFTINGLKFYTPGQLIYEFFPMFRVMSRLSVLIHFNLLIVMAILFENFALRFKHKEMINLVVLSVFMFTTIETYVPVKFLKMQEAPPVYTYLGKKAENSPVRYAVYPSTRARESFYWLPVHKSYLVNMRGINSAEFNSDKFTRQFQEKPAAGLLNSFDIEYMIYYKNSLGDKENMFLSYPGIIIEREFADSYLIKVLR